jgi:hypothetical protein
VAARRAATDLGAAAGDRELARFLNAVAEPGDVLAVTDIGQFGFYSDLVILDMAGLVTARSRVSSRARAGTHRRDEPRCLHADPRFAERYVHVPSPGRPPYELFVRRNRPITGTTGTRNELTPANFN